MQHNLLPFRTPREDNEHGKSCFGGSKVLIGHNSPDYENPSGNTYATYYRMVPTTPTEIICSRKGQSTVVH